MLVVVGLLCWCSILGSWASVVEGALSDLVSFSSHISSKCKERILTQKIFNYIGTLTNLYIYFTLLN